jgi:hypothetical protein
VLGQGGVPLGELLRVLHGGDQLVRRHWDDRLNAVDLLACVKNILLYIFYIYITQIDAITMLIQLLFGYHLITVLGT